jgi:hypothetical protein
VAEPLESTGRAALSALNHSSLKKASGSRVTGIASTSSYNVFRFLVLPPWPFTLG